VHQDTIYNRFIITDYSLCLSVPIFYTKLGRITCFWLGFMFAYLADMNPSQNQVIPTWIYLQLVAVCLNPKKKWKKNVGSKLI